MASEVSTNYQDDECKDCRIRKFCGNDVVECLEKKDCDWIMHFGYGRFCKHPSALQYTNSRLSRYFD